MQQARCPHCQQKLQIPDALPPGTMLQCAGCNNQFLPPASSSQQTTEPLRKKKKGRRAKAGSGWTTRSIILVTSLVSIGLLLGTLVLIWLMQPGYAKFNEQLVAQYNRFNELLSAHVNPRPINNLSTFLKQFEQLGPQFHSLQEESKKLRAPEDQKGLLEVHSKLMESMNKFCQSEVPQYLEELKKKPNNEATATEMVKSLYNISTLHESLVGSQNWMAKQHGLLQIQPRADAPFFLSLNAQRR